MCRGRFMSSPTLWLKQVKQHQVFHRTPRNTYNLFGPLKPPFFLDQAWDIIKQEVVHSEEEKPFRDTLGDGLLSQIHKGQEDQWEISFHLVNFWYNCLPLAPACFATASTAQSALHPIPQCHHEAHPSRNPNPEFLSPWCWPGPWPSRAILRLLSWVVAISSSKQLASTGWHSEGHLGAREGDRRL